MISLPPRCRSFVYTNIVFEWDAAKAETNLAKHGVSFEEARPSSSTLTRWTVQTRGIPAEKSDVFDWDAR